jgi:hypothetical protein
MAGIYHFKVGSIVPTSYTLSKLTYFELYLQCIAYVQFLKS